MGADEDWTQEVRARRRVEPPTRADASDAPTRADASEAPTRADASEAPTHRARPRSIAGEDEPSGPAGPFEARRTRPLDRREIQELDIAEPPTARLGRSAPTVPRHLGEPEEIESHPPEPDPSEAETLQRTRKPPADPGDDQLTIRLDRPG
jgi:hypothetical protein